MEKDKKRAYVNSDCNYDGGSCSCCVCGNYYVVISNIKKMDMDSSDSGNSCRLDNFYFSRKI